MNSASLVNGNTVDLQRFRSPHPAAGRSFGTSAAGVGNLVGDPTENEILIGEFSTHNPPQNDEVVGEVGFFDAVTGNPLQTITDPDSQPVANFGVGVAPMGDVNLDGFLDFAVGSGRFDRAGITDPGRIYLFRSNNTAPPPPPPPPVTPPPPPPPPPPPSAQVAVVAGRTLELVASPARVRRGRSVSFTGTLEAFSNAPGCQDGREIEIQRRPVASAVYTTISRVTTSAGGAFKASATADRASFYRARIGQDAECAGAVSAREQVDVAPDVRLVTKTARLTSNRQLRLQVDCRTADGPSNGTVKLRTTNPVGGRKRTLPTASFQSPGDARRSVTVTVSAQTLALLRRSRNVAMQAFVIGRDARGNSTTITAKLTV